jgi:hypothetical protein
LNKLTLSEIHDAALIRSGDYHLDDWDYGVKQYKAERNRLLRVNGYLDVLKRLKTELEINHERQG